MMVGEKDADSLVEIQTGIWVDKLIYKILISDVLIYKVAN